MYDSINQMSGIVNALSNQQKTLTNNLANAHTPGYTRQKINFHDVMSSVGGQSPYETNLSSRMGSMMTNGMVENTGETVDIAHEMVDMQQVFMNYSLVTRRMTTVFNNLRRATQIGR